MYNYYNDQILPVINAQKEINDKYRAKIKIYAGGDNCDIKSNFMDVTIEQLEKIKKIIENK